MTLRVLILTNPPGGTMELRECFSEFDNDELLALAQLSKRIGFKEINLNAKNVQEAHLMRSAIDKLADLLAEVGFCLR